jgi:hypothetical protein
MKNWLNMSTAITYTPGRVIFFGGKDYDESGQEISLE